MKYIIKITNSVGTAYISELILNKVAETGEMIVNTNDDINKALKFSSKEDAEMTKLMLMRVMVDKTASLEIKEDV